MAPKSAFYVPCLRWRLAERQALAALTNKAKDSVVPLITIPDLEFDFEDGTPKKNVGEHVGTFPKRYKEKWETRKAWIDVDSKIQTELMPNGRPVFTYFFDEIRKFKADAVPVASLDCIPMTVAQIAAVIATDKKGVGTRARIEHVMKANFGASLDALLKSLKVTPEQTDLIVDLGTPNYEPYAAFATALAVALGEDSHPSELPQFRPRRLRLPGHLGGGDVAGRLYRAPRLEVLYTSSREASEGDASADVWRLCDGEPGLHCQDGHAQGQSRRQDHLRHDRQVVCAQGRCLPRQRKADAQA